MLLKDFPELDYSISYTSRPKRTIETSDVNYHFVTRQKFEELIREDYFFEWAMVHDNYYGTPKVEIMECLAQGKKVILDIDVKGAQTVRSKVANSLSFFILPPSEEVWIQRLKKRGTETEETLAKRIANGRKELNSVDEFDYKITNDNLYDAYNRLTKIMNLKK